MNGTTIAVTDNDHEDMDIEMEVLNKAGFDAPWFDCKTEDDLIKNCQGFTALINQYAPFTEKVFKELPDLKMVVRYGVGVDNVDLEAATKYGVSVCNVPDYGMNEVADHAIALMLTLVRKVVLNNNLIREGVWDFKKSMPLYRLSAQTVGVIGIGRIGSAFAERAHAFGLKVIAYDEYAVKSGNTPDFIEMVSLEELIGRSDIISIHCPLDGNEDLIAKEELRKMKKNAYLVNVSRGGIINEVDLAWALENNEIAGAACDVFKPEPVSKDSPLLKFENFLCSPHIAWYSEESAADLARGVAKEAVRSALGQELLNVVNK